MGDVLFGIYLWIREFLDGILVLVGKHPLEFFLIVFGPPFAYLLGVQLKKKTATGLIAGISVLLAFIVLFGPPLGIETTMVFLFICVIPTLVFLLAYQKALSSGRNALVWGICSYLFIFPVLVVFFLKNRADIG